MGDNAANELFGHFFVKFFGNIPVEPGAGVPFDKINVPRVADQKIESVKRVGEIDLCHNLAGHGVDGSGNRGRVDVDQLPSLMFITAKILGLGDTNI